MGRVIAYAEGAVNEVGDPPGCPDLTPIPIRLSPWSEERRQLCHLIGRQLGGRTRRSLAAQRLDSSPTHAAHPLAHRAFGHPERDSDVLLFPALLL